MIPPQLAVGRGDRPPPLPNLPRAVLGPRRQCSYRSLFTKRPLACWPDGIEMFSVSGRVADMTRMNNEEMGG